MNIELQSMAIDLPPIAAHPNRAPFRGVLTLVDTPSDRAPSGARGHRVVLTRAAAPKIAPSKQCAVPWCSTLRGDHEVSSRWYGRESRNFWTP